MKKAILFIVLCLFSGVIYAQEESTFTYEKYSSIGLYLGSVSGIGLSYRYHLANPWLFQVTGGLISIEKDLAYSVGFEGQYELSKSRTSRFYVMGGTGLYGSKTQDNVKGGTESSTTFHLGFGIGGEIAFGSSIVGNLTIGVNFFPIALYAGDGETNIYPGGSIYLYYNW